MYTSTTVLGEFSELQYSLSPSYQASRLLVYYCSEWWFEYARYIVIFDIVHE